MPLPDLLTLEAGALRARICPHIGGALFDLLHRDEPVMRVPAADALEHRNARALACFPLVPYSNRIADGRFSWQGETYQLDHNFPDHPHTMHGVGWQQPWDVTEQTPERLLLSLEYDPEFAGLYTWPFRFSATLLYALDMGGLTMQLSLRNQASFAWPAGLGFHPHFPRDADLRLDFHADHIWGRDDLSLPTVPEAIPPAWCFDPPQTIQPPMLDNCYAGWDGKARLVFPARSHAVTLTAGPCFRHLVAYTPDHAPYMALEPVTHLPDAINRMQGDDWHGLRLLQPDDVWSAKVRLDITPA